MAKKSMLERESRRRKTVKKYAAKRAELKEIMRSPKSSDDEKMTAMARLQALPRDASPVRLRNRIEELHYLRISMAGSAALTSHNADVHSDLRLHCLYLFENQFSRDASYVCGNKNSCVSFSMQVGRHVMSTKLHSCSFRDYILFGISTFSNLSNHQLHWGL